MADLNPGVELVTDDPTLAITTKLAPGKYRFQLVVEDDRGLRSEPAIVEVQVLAPPVAVLSVTPNGPVKVGENFTLDGSKSTDADGKIVKYRWTMIAPNRDGGRGRDRE